MRATGWLFVACVWVFGVPLFASAMEYRFEKGQYWSYKVLSVEPPAEVQCQMTVTCDEVGGAAHGAAGDSGESRNPVYTLRVGLTEPRIKFQHEQRSSYPYEDALERLTNFSYVVVMDSSGRLLSSSFAESARKVDCGSSNATALVTNDVILPLTVAIWRHVFPRFLSTKDERMVFGSQDCAKLGMPEFSPLNAYREGYRVRRDARMPDGAKGCAIWEDIVETQSTRELGDSEDIAVHTRMVMLFDNSKGAFTRVSDLRMTERSGAEGKRAARTKAYFICELVDPKKDASSAVGHQGGNDPVSLGPK